MINQDGFCDHCRRYHYPDSRYWNECPNPHMPVPRAPQPTLEEQFAAQMQALEAKIAEENRVRQREQERLDRQHALERARFDEDMRRFHAQRAAERAAKLAEVKAAMAEMHTWRKTQAQVHRLELKLEARAQEQQAKAKARANQLTETIAACEREQTTPRAAQQANDGKRGHR